MTATDAQPADRRTRRRERTRAELLESARALIAERGVAALRVSDVTDRSDVALGSFYNHFETKDEIVAAVVAEAVSSLADAIGAIADRLDDPAEAMSVGARRLIRLGREEPELARLLLALDHAEERFRQMVWPRAHTVMAAGVKSGRFAAESPELLLTLAIAGVFAALAKYGAPDAPDDLPEQAATALLRLVGLQGAEAREIARRPLP
jgi:AcrR family transcriptional regulator